MSNRDAEVTDDNERLFCQDKQGLSQNHGLCGEGERITWKRMWSAIMPPSSATVLSAPLEESYTNSPSGCSGMPGRRSRWPSSGAAP